jgi:hypothetical protein
LRTFAPMQYSLLLAEEKIKPHQVTTLHLLCAFSFVATGAIIAIYNYTIPGWGFGLLGIGLVLLLLTIIRNRWVSGKLNLPLRLVELAISVVIAAYSIRMQWKIPIGIFSVLAAALMFSLWWERRMNNALYVDISDEGLRLPVTSRKRFIPWQEVEQVILRYGTLTIDCITNQLFQWTVADDIDIDAGRFETYCMEQVEANKGKRRTDDW